MTKQEQLESGVRLQLCRRYPMGLNMGELKASLKGTTLARATEKKIVEALEALQDKGLVELLYKKEKKLDKPWARATSSAVKGWKRSGSQEPE
ncbi:MAG: hypothetical protein KAJ07_10570 [Planctomycetes bacterium]|nr:hypothetical protein [Planctomycetota bacterium]